MAKWEDAPSPKWEDAPEIEDKLIDTAKEYGKVGANLVTGLGSMFVGAGSALTGAVASVFGLNDKSLLEDFALGSEKTQKATRLDYKNKDSGAAKTEEKVMEALDWLTEKAGRGAAYMMQQGPMSPLSMGGAQGVESGVPENEARMIGEIGSNFIPLERAFSGLRRSPKLPTLSPEELAALEAMKTPEPTGFPKLDEIAPPMEPGYTSVRGQQQPFPILDERVPMLPEQPRPVESTAFPILEEAPVRDTSATGIKLEEPIVPPDAPRPLDITPDDRPIPHVPNRQFENVVEPKKSLLPEDNLFDALLNKEADLQRIRDMEANTRTEQLRGEAATIDFPLRQEVLNQPDIKRAIDNFRIEAERLKDMPEQLAKLQEEFAAVMKQLGIDKASDAYGRALYEAGLGTKLPIEHPLTMKEQTKAGEKTPWSDFARTNKWPENPLGTRNKMGRFVPKSQRGMINPKVFLEGIKKLANSVKIGSRIKMNLPWVEGGYEVDAVIKNTVYKDENGRVTSNTNPKASPYYVLEYIINGEKINNSFSSTQLLENGKTLGGIPLGQTAKGSSQRGGRKVDQDFIKFKNRLPENMRGRAKVLYAHWQEMNKPKPVEMHKGEQVEKAISNIEGLNAIVNETAPINMLSPEEVKPHILSEPDTKISRIGKQVKAGGQLTAFETKNTLIRYIADNLNSAVRKATVLRNKILLDKETGVKAKWQGLSAKEQADAVALMRSVEGKQDLPDMTNLSPKQKEAIKTLREALQLTHNKINEGRAALGLKPLPYREGYLSSIWRGDFFVPVLDKSGNVVIAITAKTKKAALKAQEFLKTVRNEDGSLKYEGYTYGPMSNRARFHHKRKDNSIQEGFNEIMSLLKADDPRVADIQSVFEDFLQQQAYETGSTSKHFQAKRETPMLGYEGGKEWLSPEQNALEAVRAQMNYMEQAFRWSELQKASVNVNKILSDPDVMNKTNAYKYAKEYWERGSGRTHYFEQLLDGMMSLVGDITGKSVQQYKDAGAIVKKALTIKFLGVNNVAFAGSQAWQPMQMMPHWLTYLQQKGATGNLMVSGAKATWDLHAPTEKMSDFGKEAMDWAKENGVADSQILEDLRSSETSKFFDMADNIAGWLPTKIENYSRYNAFLNYAHFLHDSGVPKKQAFETAGKITDMSMTNYHLHERPLLYRNLGALGDLASALTTFKHNQWHQMQAFGIKGRRINLAPMIAAQLFAGGLMGFYGRDEIDSVIRTINSIGLFDTHIPTLRSWLLQEMPDYAVFGGVSKLTGMDMSSKLSAADVLPNNAAEALFPYMGELGLMASSLWEMTKYQDAPHVKKAAHRWLPSSLKWTLENENEEGMTIDPQKHAGMYQRDLGDKIARMAGGYSMEESRERLSRLELKEWDAWRSERADVLLTKVKGVNSPEELGKLFNKYVALGGEEENFLRSLDRHQKNQLLSAWEQEKGTEANTTRQIMKILEAQKYERAKQ